MGIIEGNGTRRGLALSGGGFRASFFHIGVLARLAEIGRLHEIEFISTVSGGSILGALYYLHVKKLLESKLDDEDNPLFLKGCDLHIEPNTIVYVADHNDQPFYKGCSCHTGKEPLP